MQKPLVTIGISFFNNQDTLDDAITSVINQSFSDWELILIDGGSVDQSLAVAQQYLDDRIVLISEGHYKGFVESLNQSVSLASGKYYARMDADDVMHPERLEQQVHFLDIHPEVDVVDTAMYAMNQAGELTGERSIPPPAKWTLSSILAGQALNHATVMGRIEWFRSHPYDPLYVRAEDMELWCRTVGCSVFARIMHPLYYVREGQVNVVNYCKSQKTSRRIFRQYGPKALPSRKIHMLVLKSYLKAFIYTVMGWVGMQGMLTNTRNTKLGPEVIAEARQMFRVGIKR